jgi:large subunit ribosomal protein L3
MAPEAVLVPDSRRAGAPGAIPMRVRRGPAATTVFALRWKHPAERWCARRSVGVHDRRPEDVTTKAIVGEKVGMTQVWDDQNRAVPVTVLRVAPVRVTQVKTPEREGYSALQVTWGFRRPGTLTKAERGHYERAGVEPGRRLVELRLDDVSQYEVGQELTAEQWSAGEKVDAIAVSKGKGFAGGMKRHHFKGQGAAHGNHKHHRAPGSIGGCATPSRVFRGTRMAGRLGGRQVTALNLELVSSDPERGLMLVRGAVPGARGGVVVLRDSVKVPAGRNGAGR